MMTEVFPGDRDATSAFDGLLHASASAVERHGGREQEVPADWAHAHKVLPSGELNMHTREWRLADRAEFFAVTIRAPKIDIVTQFLYPAPDRDLPVFAMEFVLLGTRPIVAVIDAAPLVPDSSVRASTMQMLKCVHENYPDLTQADDPPPWFVQCRSGGDFFVRPTEPAAFEALGRAQMTVLEAVLSMRSEARVLDEGVAAAHAQAMGHWRAHHRENSPGLPLMHRSFGVDWTNRYMNDYLFR